MRTRAVVAAAVLSCAIVSGGWLVQRGLIATARPSSDKVDGGRLFDQVVSRVRDDYVDSAAGKDIYRKAVDGLMLELGDPHSSYLTSDRLSRLNETTSGKYAGVGLQIDIRDGWITVVTPLPDRPPKRLVSGPAIGSPKSTGSRRIAGPRKKRKRRCAASPEPRSRSESSGSACRRTFRSSSSGVRSASLGATCADAPRRRRLSRLARVQRQRGA